MERLPPPTKVEIAPGYMFLLLAPAAVFVGTEYFLGAFGDSTLIVPGAETRADAVMYELTGRYKFYAALFFYGAVGIAVAGVFLFDLIARHTWRSMARTGLGVGFVFAIAIVFTILEPEGAGARNTWENLGLNAYEITLGAGRVDLCPAGAVPDCSPRTAFEAMQTLLAAINLFGALGASGAILGTILTLARPLPRNDLATDAGRKSEARALSGARIASQRYLYCSGLMLSSGMTVLIAWMNWPAASLAPEATRAAYVDLAGALSLFVGVSYSLVILSYYMPVSLILASRINRLRHVMGNEAEAAKPSEEVAEQRLPAIGQLDALKAIIAILSPILASAVGSFGNAILFE